MNTESNAMTEVALALAMAFFAIFVLTAVSMGLPQSKSVDKLDVKIATIEFSAPGNKTRLIREEETLIIYSKGRYYDQFLKLLDQDQFSARHYVLAVSPLATVSEIMSAKQPLGASKVSITLLNQAWLARLDEI